MSIPDIPNSKKFSDFSNVANDRRSSQKSGMCLENRNSLNSPNLSLTISGCRQYWRFWFFISRQNIGWLGYTKTSDHLGFSWHMKTRPKLHFINLLKGNSFFIMIIKLFNFCACSFYRGHLEINTMRYGNHLEIISVIFIHKDNDTELCNFQIY